MGLPLLTLVAVTGLLLYQLLLTPAVKPEFEDEWIEDEDEEADAERASATGLDADGNLVDPETGEAMEPRYGKPRDPDDDVIKVVESEAEDFE